jgi:hypothetical protein
VKSVGGRRLTHHAQRILFHAVEIIMTRKSLSDELRDRASKALISFAVFRWESAVTLALILILGVFFPKPFPFWQWWFWLILGLVAEALIIVTSIYDPAVRERVVGEMFMQKFNPREVRSPIHRAKIVRALEYRTQMEMLVQRTRDGALRAHLDATVNDVGDWLGGMFGLALKLDQYDNNSMLKRDLQSVPKDITALEERLKTETDAQVRAQLKQSTVNKRAHLRQLEKLDNTMERAALQLDDTLSAMGTIYAQMQLIGAKDIDSGRAQRLREDIVDEVNSLHDIVEAMDQVYLEGA